MRGPLARNPNYKRQRAASGPLPAGTASGAGTRPGPSRSRPAACSGSTRSAD